ncbi:tRNA (adenosine(37)-N6)-threonylcarbamoyltransferase complex ATPase subunit type 1 TsaE [Bacillus sp. B15-48]|uniref:tRNA (adenosine(37)-N6)-threonylcarbamoyltransferase complex ATPase subunit type 1 TsaE n=1 Tax=Bacillus sp. B15-48 TaxID=1548601 RepID=UPI00193EF6A1|nr:tRNA (adenosine(37)-N6)-threonylcarbamoyltransferase complex ATPase subunit type 1 TsaE [Bacillus sp. B15-48]MBM4765376.1 tRNA (adenosine(37)-N6)-threonylcarbamoyltransferase complex ATPase subunit type 1 TsaE [Bacillus sp. B15-48]
MAAYEFISEGPKQTHDFAKRLAILLKEGDVIGLEGDLGAGKTTFTKGLAEGLGISRTVNSPTFTIIKEYKGKLPLYHMDVYRVEDSFEDLGFEEYFEGNGVTVVEWAHLIDTQLPEFLLTIHLFHGDNGLRRIVLEPKGSRYEQLCKELFNENSIN